MKTLALNCNHCGGNLDVPDATRFVTCTYCDTSLRVVNEGGAAYTEILARIEENTEEITDRLDKLEHLNELERLDREWMMTRETLLVTDKQGVRSEPSATKSMFGAAAALAFGVVWISLVASTNAPWPMIVAGLIVVGMIVVQTLGGVGKASEYERALREYERRRSEIESRAGEAAPSA